MSAASAFGDLRQRATKQQDIFTTVSHLGPLRTKRERPKQEEILTNVSRLLIVRAQEYISIRGATVSWAELIAV